MKHVLTAAFCQVDTIHGHRFIDDAGKIMNAYDDEFPLKNVAVTGLVMQNNAGSLRQVQVSSQRIWLSFAQPESYSYVEQRCRDVVHRVCEITDVTAAHRVGVRLELVYDIDENVDKVRAVARRLFSKRSLPDDPSLASFEATIETKTERSNVALRVRPVQRVESPDDSDLPNLAMMFDVDFFHAAESVSLGEFDRLLRVPVHWMNNDLPNLEHIVFDKDEK